MTQFIIYVEINNKYIIGIEAETIEEAADKYYEMSTAELNTYISDTDGGIDCIDVDGVTYYPDHKTGEGFHK